MPNIMKCHYEVLEAARDADADTLKKQYRKMALKYHPDKNPDDPEGAKQTFQVIQQAYDVLSDPQERAWYDNHREQILRGGLGEKLEEEGIDLFQYFSSSCYSGFSDDESGFYGVYNEVFNTLAKEDMDFIDDEDSDFEIPCFGKMNDDYESVVGPFYAYWTGYSTPRSYTWLDKYDTRQGENRWVKRKMEAENKKVRDKAKKERNDVVRNLVQFVRKRDKRVAEHGKKLQEKAELNKKKTLEFQKKQREERKKLFVADGDGGGNFNLTEMEEQLRQLEGQYTDSDSDGEEEQTLGSEEEEGLGEELDDLYCVACDKLFKTVGARDNHETSKKHKDNLQKLIEEMNEEVDNSDHDGSDSNHVNTDQESNHVNTDQEDFKKDIEVASNHESRIKSKSKKQKKKQRKNVDSVTTEESNLANDGKVEEDDHEPRGTKSLSKKQKRKQKKKIPDLLNGDDSESEHETKIVNPIVDSSEDEVKSKKSKAKKSKKKSKKEKPVNSEMDGLTTPDDSTKLKETPIESKECVDNADEEEITIIKASASENKDQDQNEENFKLKGEEVAKADHLCAQCRATFPSKNKLFSHLKISGHAVHIPTENPPVTKKSRKKNKK